MTGRMLHIVSCSIIDTLTILHSCFNVFDVLTFCDEIARTVIDLVTYTCKTVLIAMFGPSLKCVKN